MKTAFMGAHRKMEELEITASEMFDRIVQAGLSPEDSAMVDRAQEMMKELAAHTEAALASGTLDMGSIFDTDYKPVPKHQPAAVPHPTFGLGTR